MTITPGPQDEDDVEDLKLAWDRLLGGLAERSAVARTGRALLALWSEPHRRFHNLTHLRQVLTQVDELSGYAADPDAVRLAAWYHDCVYQGRPDDEELSARRAESDLGGLGLPAALVAEVARLVRLTASHRPTPGDRNGEVLCDADLSGLGCDAEHYRAGGVAIEAEYGHISDDARRAGRAHFVRELLAAPTLFHTPLARSRWESQARANLAEELRDLHIDT